MTFSLIDLYKGAIEKTGSDKQKIIAIEEMAELIKEICKDLRGIIREDKLSSEMADVEISVDLLEFLYSNSYKVKACKADKIEKFKNIIYGQNPQNESIDDILPSKEPVKENKQYFVDFYDMSDGWGGLAEYFPQDQFDDLEEAKAHCNNKMKKLAKGNKSCGEHYSVIDLNSGKEVYRG